MNIRLLSTFIRTRWVHGSKEKDTHGTVRMIHQNVEMVRKDELWCGRLIVVPTKTPFRTYAGRSGTRLDNPMTKDEEAIFWDKKKNWSRSKLGILAANADKVGNLASEKSEIRDLRDHLMKTIAEFRAVKS
ncbi:hypothetical protein F2Q69_00022771 [Brassica cretica]|uniref:Uncharacterized protein n=1 Tax=Brassica cretica TaxID=69181 RepID=A0A8S9QK58_BRACR|nr:hypothetical protein F2Q69_00022771 [Brassica cretica]